MGDIWIGFTPSNAINGQKLIDNGICVLNDNSVLFATSEERLSRNKHDNRISHAINAWEKYSQQSVNTVRSIGISSCIDAPWSEKTLPEKLSDKTLHVVPSHHYSHALSAYLSSPFRETLILVTDAGGNTFSNSKHDKWWSNPREQTSLWFGINGKIHLLDRIHFEPYEIGYGEWYRAFTYYLGWHSHTLSGNTMALSAFGTPRKIAEMPLWEIIKNIELQFDPNKPIELVTTFLKQITNESLSPREPNGDILDSHRNLAAYIQFSLEIDVTKRIKESIEKYSVKQICLTGGVSQNCVMNAKVSNLLGFENVYVCPFSGDVGQCVGNALHARYMDTGISSHIKIKNTFLGAEYCNNEIYSELEKTDFKIQKLKDAELSKKAARHLFEGKIIGLYRGRSEFGPRALGHRSVIGIVDSSDVSQRIKEKIKKRDSFMPLAPVILPDFGKKLSQYIPTSKYMVYAPVIPKKFRKYFSESLHIDNTARIQVSEKGTLMYKILKYMDRTHSNPILFNTSFNSRGKPIVETPKNAISAFEELDIDYLIMGNYWVGKK